MAVDASPARIHLPTTTAGTSTSTSDATASLHRITILYSHLDAHSPSTVDLRAGLQGGYSCSLRVDAGTGRALRMSSLRSTLASAAFVDNTAGASISLASRPLSNGGASFVWSNIRGPIFPYCTTTVVPTQSVPRTTFTRCALTLLRSSPLYGRQYPPTTLNMSL